MPGEVGSLDLGAAVKRRHRKPAAAAQPKRAQREPHRPAAEVGQRQPGLGERVGRGPSAPVQGGKLRGRVDPDQDVGAHAG